MEAKIQRTDRRIIETPQGKIIVITNYRQRFSRFVDRQVPQILLTLTENQTKLQFLIQKDGRQYKVLSLDEMDWISSKEFFDLLPKEVCRTAKRTLSAWDDLYGVKHSEGLAEFEDEFQLTDEDLEAMGKAFENWDLASSIRGDYRQKPNQCRRIAQRLISTLETINELMGKTCVHEYVQIHFLIAIADAMSSPNQVPKKTPEDAVNFLRSLENQLKILLNSAHSLKSRMISKAGPTEGLGIQSLVDQLVSLEPKIEAVRNSAPGRPEYRRELFDFIMGAMEIGLKKELDQQFRARENRDELPTRSLIQSCLTKSLFRLKMEI